MDFDAAFLYAELNEVVYVKPIPDIDPMLPSGHVYKLQRTLYGLKQSPREWWLLLLKRIMNDGWIQSLSDQCVFFRQHQLGNEYLAVYVDDLLIISPDVQSIAHIKLYLSQQFDVKDLGEANFILGVRISRDWQSKKIFLDQSGLIETYIRRFLLPVHSSATTTCSFANSATSSFTASTATFCLNDYQGRIGALLYLSLHTRQIFFLR